MKILENKNQLEPLKIKLNEFETKEAEIYKDSKKAVGNSFRLIVIQIDCKKLVSNHLLASITTSLFILSL